MESLAEADWSTDEQILKDSDSEAIRQALDDLDPKYKQAMLMRYYDDFSLKEIADILRLPMGTVSRRIQIAHHLLAGKLGGKLGKTLGKGGVIACCLALFALVSSAAVALTPALAPVREAVTGWLTGETKAVVNVTTATSTPQTPQTLSNPTQEKQQMKLTSTFAAAALAVTAAVVTVEADGVTLQVDQVRQRYPWNGLVDIDYTVSGDDAAVLGRDDNLEILLVNRDVTPAETNRALTFLQAPLPLTAGQHRITWDANADGMTNRIEQSKIIAKIAHYSAVYMVIDVSDGPTAESFPVDFLNGAPPNGFNVDEYKGNKIVLRRIYPGSYAAGSPTTEANRGKDPAEKQHRVAFSRPFYIGIFEVTQKQYYNVTGNDPSHANSKGDFRPVDSVSYNVLRGTANTTTHQYDWPYQTDVDPASFMGILLAKCKSKNPSTGLYDVSVTGFDLPTEFQWEFACRAGTTGAIATTNAYDNASSSDQVTQLALMGRYAGNKSSGAGGFSTYHTVVGSYLPNPWGLYDMHGNVLETCVDWAPKDPSALKQYVDPEGEYGGDSALGRGARGGCYEYQVGYCRSAARLSTNPKYGYQFQGFRLCRTLP